MFNQMIILFEADNLLSDTQSGLRKNLNTLSVLIKIIVDIIDETGKGITLQ